MKGINFLLPLIALFLFEEYSGAQSLNQKALDEKYTPPKGSQFGKAGVKNSSGNTLTRNLLGWNALLLPRGILAGSYSRAISETVVLTGSIGLTVFPDYMLKSTAYLDFSSTSEDGPPEKPGKFAQWATYMQFNSQPKSTPKLFYELGIKKFSKDAFDGFYYGLSYRHYNLDNVATLHTYVDDKYVANREFLVPVKTDALQLIWGACRGEKEIHDFYFGFGLRRFQYSGPTPVYQDINSYSKKVAGYEDVKTNFTRYAPSFLFGYILNFSL